MLPGETGEWFAYYHTHIDGKAGVIPGHAAGALHQQDMIWILLDDGSRSHVGDYLFKIRQVNRFVNQHQFF